MNKTDAFCDFCDAFFCGAGKAGAAQFPALRAAFYAGWEAKEKDKKKPKKAKKVVDKPKRKV